MLRADPRRIVRSFAVALSASVLLAGCGAAQPADPAPTPTHLDLSAWDPESGNGVDLLSTMDARAVMLDAMAAAQTATMSGVFTGADGRSITLEVTGAPKQYRATFTADEQTTSIVMLDEIAYVRAGEDAYLCVAHDDPLVTGWGMLTDPAETVAALTADAARVGMPTGETVDLILGAEGTVGTLTVSVHGEPLPVSLVRADEVGGVSLVFGGWNEPVELAVPEPLTTGC